MRDGKALTDQVNYFTELTGEQKEAARRTVCQFVVGESVEEQVRDATELLMMLGIHPSQDGDDPFDVGLPMSHTLTIAKLHS